MKLRISRKASMQLSIEAIIILVIAMVLLGLAIAFISGFFRTGTGKLLEPFNALDFGCNPDANEQIKVIPSDVSFQTTTSPIPLKICFYQKDAQIAGKKIALRLDTSQCNPKKTGTVEPAELVGVAQTVKKGDIGGFSVYLQPTAKTNTGVYICTVEAVEANADGTVTGTPTVFASKQVTITVT